MPPIVGARGCREYFGTVTDDRPQVLHRRLAEVLPAGWRDAAPWGYPQQVELALIAGVFRAQIPQAHVDAVVDVVMRARPHALFDDLHELAEAGAAGVVELLGPRWGDTNVLGVPILRAEVIARAARALVRMGIRSGDDLRTQAAERPDAVEAAVLAVRGLGMGTWEWVALLSHARIRPDSQVTKFVAQAVDASGPLDPGETSELLRLTARRFASDERTLSHALREYLDDKAA